MAKALDVIVAAAVIATAGVVGVSQYQAMRRLDALESAIGDVRRPGSVPSLDARGPKRGDVISIAGAPISGSRSAKLALIEFGDFECPFCAMFTRDVWPVLDREYVSNGTLVFAFRNMPLDASHQYARAAAEAGVCAAEQGQVWNFYEAVFRKSPLIGADVIRDVVDGLGIDDGKYRSCIAVRARSAVNADVSAAREKGISATPTFILGRVMKGETVQVVATIVGYRPTDEFTDAIDGIWAGDN
jgi:protein-disulfide isomerase